MAEIKHGKWQLLNEILGDKSFVSDLQSLENSQRLYEILDLNAVQLTHYLEEAILDNPFVEIEYPLEKQVAEISNKHLDPSLGAPAGSRQSLVVFLFEQIMMYRQTPIRDAMVRLVDYLDDRGYLPYTYQDLAVKLSLDPILTLDAMTLFKQLEPAGVGAYDLRECLMLQTEQDFHAPNTAYYLLENYFHLIGQQDLQGLVDESGFSQEEVEESLRYFHALRPEPAAIFQEPSLNRLPDLSVRVTGDQLELAYNRQFYPRLVFSQNYYDEMAQQNDPELMVYINQHKEGFLRLIQLLRLREKLIMLIGAEIINAQADFIMGIRDSKKPLLAKHIREATGISDSLVQLVIRNKSILTQDGVVSLNDYLNVTQYPGRGGLNAMNIKATLYRILDAQPPTISDKEVVELLAKEKIIMSESLVADYRQTYQK